MTVDVWSFCNADGIFVGATFSGPGQFLPANTPPGLVAVPGAHDHLSNRYDFATETVVDWQPPKPAGDEFTDHSWDDEIKRWVPFPTLAGHKRTAWEQVKRIRDEQFAAPRVADGIAYRISADRANLESVIAGRTAAGAPASMTTAWRDADNTTHALDGPALASLAVAMLTTGQAIYDRSWALQAQIDACESAEAIAAIDLAAGWP